jgi:protein SCO1/2
VAEVIAQTLAFLALASAAPASAALSPDQLARAVALPAAGTMLPAALPFHDVQGRTVTLGGIAGGRPLVVIFADYTCAHICAPGLRLTQNALAQTGLTAGSAYRVAVIGLDPKDDAAEARAMGEKMAVDARVTRATALLLGDRQATPAAAKALGYGYVYDADNDQFAHDASVYVFGDDGRLRALLPEMALTPDAIKAALAGAPTPGFAERVAHLCYGLAAAHGPYARGIVVAMQVLSVLLLAALAVFLFRRRRPV